jgi:hypothetical protein
MLRRNTLHALRRLFKKICIYVRFYYDYMVPSMFYSHKVAIANNAVVNASGMLQCIPDLLAAALKGALAGSTT